MLAGPRFDQLSGFPQVFRLVTLAVGHPTGQRVRDVGRFFDEPFWTPQTVTGGFFGLRMFFRSTPTTFSVRPASFLEKRNYGWRD